MMVEGELGIGDGWWLTLREPYDGAVGEDNQIVLQQPTRLIMPQTISADPASMRQSPAEFLAGLVEETRNDPDSNLADLGPISGQGWVGHLFREPLSPQRGEYQLLGILSAPAAVLNLAVRFLGAEGEDEARQIIADVVHDPASRDQMNAQIRRQTGIE
ncbi:MAG TPA: hypothetical protein VFQ77_10770 [Pseudonocardiaceae bacterium]|jgi:hypothetical protein|nr:hypothetical protein [Pseudonocardiaceae bacterium]